ncbi:pyrroline-5-carboxylate reductase [Phaeobacter italicus]|uniref:pyrroline-5-carboxylate reductase n=1 Tax=Phaeobacter italicus TaxID=481446 RepID=UPI000187003E|nr:pyrroline-5-carboxylate reductase [Phaeobacter italicus]EEB71127.1 pyrroline-5-carboxylate reductase [Ruegeria sp. R11]CRL16723.1 Pyrroline-5-carboxylate reductase [Phaeobacter italicus]SFH24889.1 pyrroline-5-carboxylate reductase [Phaeobacter italicus]
MQVSEIASRGIALLGCGKMGSAMLAGWLDQGVSPDAVWVIDPNPSDWLRQTGVQINAPLPEGDKAPGIVLIAVKPQMMGEALPQMQSLGNGPTLFISVAAGTSIATFEDLLGSQTPLVRAMPNTPAAIGRGITAIIGNTQASSADLDRAEALLQAIGQIVRLESEGQIDAVTGVSGSGPAYVFHLIETLAAAGEAEGLPADLAMQLAKATVAGAGALAEAAEETPSQLRVNVTSPNGTTQAALEVLMNEADGFPTLLRRAVGAATERSKELSRG